MLKLGQLVLDGSRPIVAVPFSEPPRPEAVRRARAAGLDVLELRIDRRAGIREGGLIAELAELGDVPTIATIRSKAEGGGSSGSEPERLEIFRRLAGHVSAVDIELASTGIRQKVVSAAHEAGRLAIVSFHDFERTPPLEALMSTVAEARTAGADIVKIATMATSDGDVRTLARLLLEQPSTPMIAIAMGPHGIKSRLFFPALGSLITFAALETSTAPGQPGLGEMVAELRALYPAYNQRQ